MTLPPGAAHSLKTTQIYLLSILFIFSLFNDAFSITQTARQMNEKLDVMWKEAAVAYFDVQLPNFPEGTEKTTKTSVRTVGLRPEI
jgi:hypothetical protein